MLIPRFPRHALSIALSSILLTGCSVQQIQDNASSAWEGTTAFVSENSQVVGAVVGAAIGYAVSGKSDSGLGLLAGALVGGIAGDQLGKYLGTNDRAALEQHSLAQMNGSGHSQSSTWSSAETGASATVTTGKSSTQVKPVEVVKLKHVEVTPNLELIGETYIAKTSLNVRSSPGVQPDNKVGGLSPQAEFTAVGKTPDGWLLIAQEGVSVGYVSGNERYVAPVGERVSMLRDGGIDLDALDEEAVVAGINLDGIDLDNVEVDKVEVTASTECREINYEIDSPEGKKGDASFNACRGADGAWELG